MNLINNLRLMGAMLVILLFSTIASTTAFAGEKFSGELNAAKPNVTHTIHMPVNGTLTIEITASKKQNIAGITLRDSDNKTVLGSGSRVSNKTTTNKFSLLRAGTYYLELRKDGRTSYYGSYTVDTRVTGQPFANDTEANDTFNTTGLLDVRTTVTGHLGARGQQQEQDIRDYWKLTMPSDGELALEVTTSKGLNLRGGVYIYDNDRKNKLYGEYQGPDSKKVHRLAALRAGTYYVLLEKDGRASYWGSYQLKASVNRQPFANDAVANDTFDTASLLDVRATVAGHLGSRGQQRDQDMRDYWKLTIPSDGELALEVTTSKGLNLRGGVYIYDSDRKNKLYGEYQGPDSKKVHRLAALKAGTYYILLEKDGRASYWGSYQLKASFTPASTASDKDLPSALHDSGDLSNPRVSDVRPVPQTKPGNSSAGVTLENGNSVLLQMELDKCPV